ncbi:MAG: site-2 protease family protein, partial [Elusimicrobiota bacterium]|nr:site-2 protease family protein [Elusimicrobiota bacterium]
GAGVYPTAGNGAPALRSNVIGSASLVPALSPALAPAAFTRTFLAAVKAQDESKLESRPSASAAPEGTARPSEPDSGPRWVKPATQPKPSAGPRWVGPGKSGVRAALAKFLPFLGRTGGENFDGDTARKGAGESAVVAAQPGHSRAVGLEKAATRANTIINDAAIPTPEAARRVGDIRKESGTPLWAKVVAPLSVVAAVAVAIQFGAVPVLTLAVGLVISVLAHEVAHIAVLHRLGDRTAEHAHSHSLNPFVHIDAVKTVIVPAVSLALSSAFLSFPLLLGAGKPVDADFNNLRSPFGGPRSARNAFWVAAAGPATNLLLAGVAFGAAALLPAGGVLALVAAGLWKMNLALAVFNLLPLPQLDGGKILASVLPERFYAKWVFNPKVERGYQGVFRRLYEGPSNVLTWLADAMGVRTQKGVNALANTVTFAALAAFYAAAYFNFALSLPLLFLALPCSYDYWCIREKVRSEAAVQDLMELMSQWSAVIVQIAEDLGLDSEVSAYETEHAMKNALETLVDEMMAKEEFRALSDDQKLEALMKEYPDKAAEFLKNKAMPEDSIEKIKAVLADPRNGPFYERLRKWFKEHEIFARWDNKHQQEKLKDAMKGADKPKQRGAGGSGLAAIAAVGLGAGAGLFPDLAPHASAILGGLG